MPCIAIKSLAQKYRHASLMMFAAHLPVCMEATLLYVRRIYDLYTDFVLKNPFYEVEMPIRCELFDTNLFATIGMLHRRWGVVTS